MRPFQSVRLFKIKAIHGRNELRSAKDAIQTRWVTFLSAQQSTFYRYTIAVCLSLASLGLIFLLEKLKVGSGIVLSIDLAAVVTSALLGGLGPSITTAIIVSLGEDYLFIQPTHSIATSLSDLIRIFIDISVAILTGVLVIKLRSTIQELNAAREQAIRAVEARQEILNIVAHDLKNPISAIQVSSSLLRKFETEEKDVQKRLNLITQIQNSGTRMLRLIQDLLDTAKIESGHFVVKPSWNRSSKLIHELLNQFQNQASQKQIQIQYINPNQDFELYCDFDPTLRVLGNLVSNAIKFSKPLQVIQIEAKNEAKFAKFSVTDQGHGISKSDLPQLFNRHWQAKSTAHQGTGLGLYIVKGIVSAHQGSVQVESDIGKGTRFTITLPVPAAPRGSKSNKAA